MFSELEIYLDSELNNKIQKISAHIRFRIGQEAECSNFKPPFQSHECRFVADKKQRRCD